MTLPNHLFVSSSDGALYDTRLPQWSKQRPLRAPYQYPHATIKTVAQFKATLRAGPYAWPGGYPLYFLTSDSAVLCFPCARKESRNVFEAIRTNAGDGWRVDGCDVNYEDNDLWCDHCSKQIDAAYSNN